MTNHEIGNVYKGTFEYQDAPGSRDYRRLLLVDIVGEAADTGIVTQITSQPPKSPPGYYDQFREPIEKWQQAGLTKPSYARVNKNIAIPLSALAKPIGKLDDEDFARIAVAVFTYLSQHGFKH